MRKIRLGLESVMDSNRHQRLRMMLTERVNRLRSNATELSGKNQLDPTVAALLRISNDRLLDFISLQNQLVAGSYGNCKSCGGEIHEDKLKVFPFSALCQECQFNEDKIERRKLTREQLRGSKSPLL